MKPMHKHNIPWLLAGSSFLGCAAWAAQPLTITNPSFEDPAVPNNGSYVATATGWSNVGSASEIGVFNPAATDFTAEAPEGSNVGYVFGGVLDAGLSQVLAAKLDADSSYTLSVKVGNSISFPYDGYRIQLLAGGTVLAEDDNTQSPASDSFVTASVTYNYNVADAALVGQPLEIRLLGKGLSGLSTGETEFDDVQLNATLGNPIANAGGPYEVAINGSLSLDGSGSLASDGETVTTYEWDLDNDGDFDEAITGATPASISYADLQSSYGMAVGANTIKLKVTDSADKTSTVEGTVSLAPPIGCQLGVLDLSANGGINPNTGNPWQVGDQYRIAFHTQNTTTGTSNDPNFYNDFATAEAWQVTALQGSYWKAMVTVNLDPTTTEALSPKSLARDNTGTSDLTGGAGVGGAGHPVYVTDGSTCIARNNADIWNFWSNPFNGDSVIRLAAQSANLDSNGNSVTASQNVHYSPYLNQFGLGDSANIHGKDVATGCNTDGTLVNALGNTTDNTTYNRGASNANTTGRVWNRFTDATTTARSLYVISVPLTVIDLSETVAPNLLSIVDDRAGADAILGVDSVVYTVTFSESIDASTLTLDDFENTGTASVTFDSIRGTVDPASFEVTVTPTTAGTIQLQTKVAAVIEDPAGNAVDTSSAITDDTTITVLSDTTPPTLASIEDNISGGPAVAFVPVTYTVTFDEGIDASTVDIADFVNGGSAPVTISSVAATGNPAVFLVVVNPAGAGDLTLAIAAGATINDLAGNPLDTSLALPDDTTITVEPDPAPTLVSIEDNQAGGPVFAGQSFTYFVTFSQTVDPSSVDVTDFDNGGSPAITVNAVARTSNPAQFAVHVTPGGAGTITLQVAAGAVITNVNGTQVDTTSALADDTTITVNAGSGPERGTITVDGFTAWSANSGTLSGTFDASGSDKLVVIVTGEHGFNNTDGNVTSVTYDGVPLTPVIQRRPLVSGTDVTYNHIWILDNPAAAHVSGNVVANVVTRGNVTVFGLSGTAPGVGQTAISGQASKSVVLSTTAANSVVIVSHGMGGDGNTANATAVDAVAPLIETSAQSSTGNLWDGHVTGYALTTSPGTAAYEFTGGNINGTHTIAAEFLAAEAGGGIPYDTWIAGTFATDLTDPTPSLDFDAGGLATGLEWVLGGDPTDGADDAGIAPTFDNTTDPDFFIFTYRRADEAAADANTAIMVEYGSDLAGWTEAVAGADVEIIETDDGAAAGIDLVAVKIRRTLAVGGKLFARLNVTVVTP
ncbi:MAG: beta strand repeat-containing protein [Luteolibacter sp.]